MDYIAVTRDFMKLHNFVTIIAYVMFVKNMPFLSPMRCSIKLVIIGYVPTHTDKRLITS